MFESVLVANRGEIACRVVRTLARLGIKAVTVHSEADADARHVREGDESYLLGPAPAAESYLDGARVLEAARVAGVQAVHPGYGFLSEDPAFARAVLDVGLAWVGPSPAAMALMADKVAARRHVAAAGVSVAPGTDEPVHDVDAALAAAARLGYPLMVKATAGGGGIGMSVAHDDDGLRTAVATARSRAERFFGNPALLLERYVAPARHVEVQVLGLTDGQVVALGERDCSVQRRHQKVAEETPCPVLTPQQREQLLGEAVRAAESVDYRGAGTVEFLLDPTTGAVAFLEMNTRLQVEHPVTELVTGLDLVEEQLRVAAGEPPTWAVSQGGPGGPPPPAGAALELRVYAEDPVRFLPGPGRVARWQEPTGEGVRVDAGYAEGDVVHPHYDPLLAKLCTVGADRAEALERARAAVDAFVVEGPKVNLPFLRELLDDEAFVSGVYDTGVVERLRPPRGRR